MKSPIFDFSSISESLDGMSLYARKSYDYFKSRNGMFLFSDYVLSKDHKGSKLISNKFLHRLKLYFFHSKGLYYSPTQHAPIFYRNKVITVHDITPLLLMNKSFYQFCYYNFLLRASVKYSKAIITVSNFSKNLIVDKYGVDPSLIHVIHNGSDIGSTVSTPIEGKLPEKFVFIPGVHSKYKNLERLLISAQKYSDLFVVATGSYAKKIEGHYPNLIVLPRLKVSELNYVYRKSLGLVYPSEIEGFGLPALEAAILGTPIITSKDSSMSEFLGDKSAIYVDPLSVDSIRQGLQYLYFREYPEEYLLNARNVANELTWNKHFDKVSTLLKKLEEV